MLKLLKLLKTAGLSTVCSNTGIYLHGALFQKSVQAIGWNQNNLIKRFSTGERSVTYTFTSIYRTHVSFLMLNNRFTIKAIFRHFILRSFIFIAGF